MASAGPKLVSLQNKDGGTEFYIDVEKRIVFVRFAKKTAVIDIRRYAERLRAHPSFNPKFSEIVDLREVENLDLNAPDFLKLADEIDCFSPDAWRGFVVHGSGQNHAARMHKILRLQSNMKIFTSVPDAKAWIESRPASTP